ncbi:MAG: hypothetical protein K2X11_04700 [Acetobacteraceae bacterium]|nr:hypothetical protein [Acetobacteraceae bacterium]
MLYGLLIGNEIVGTVSGNSLQSTVMDDSNNQLGLDLGARAKSFDDVVTLARAAVRAGLREGGTGTNNSPV